MSNVCELVLALNLLVSKLIPANKLLATSGVYLTLKSLSILLTISDADETIKELYFISVTIVSSSSLWWSIIITLLILSKLSPIATLFFLLTSVNISNEREFTNFSYASFFIKLTDALCLSSILFTPGSNFSPSSSTIIYAAFLKLFAKT